MANDFRDLFGDNWKPGDPFGPLGGEGSAPRPDRSGGGEGGKPA